MYSNSFVQKANENFITGDYQNALFFYLKASEFLGQAAFSVNIELCKKRISENKKPLDPKNYLSQHFDHVYVVNLEHQIEKRLRTAIQLKKSGIEFELFSAVNGYVGEPKELFDNYKKKPIGSLKRYSQWNERELKRGGHFIESPGAVGYIYTYLKILKDAKAKGFKKFLILEDDVILCNDFEVRLNDFISSIESDWKVLQLGASQYGWTGINLDNALSTGYYHPNQVETCGSFAIAFDGSIIDELIEAESAFEAPFDHLPMGEIYERYRGKCYVSYPNLVMPDVGDSTIRGGRCQYAQSEKVKWHIENFRYPYPKPCVSVILTSHLNLKYHSSFSNHADMAVELRLYYSTSDGLRPLHNASMIPADYKADQQALENACLPEADFFLTLDERAILTEQDIYSYVEHSLGLREINSTPLKAFNVIPSTAKNGRVSVVIPTYKRPKNLKNALTSVLEQDYKDIEILVVSDNGKDSPFNDETRALINELKNAYPKRNLSLLEHTQNRNGAAARNTAIMQSTGEYICFLDDDDIYLPGRISKSVDALKKSRGIDGAVYCGFLGWNSPQNDVNRYKSGDLTLEILMLDYKKHYLHTNTATYKREAVLAINGFDESYRRHQDLEFNLRFFELYDIGVVKESGVRLNPEPSDVSNKIFNIDILNLKEKFLSEFDELIKKLGKEKEIYNTHWNEVIRYIHNKEECSELLGNRYKNGSIQIYRAMK